jgi:hypothetical protein
MRWAGYIPGPVRNCSTETGTTGAGLPGNGAIVHETQLGEDVSPSRATALPPGAEPSPTAECHIMKPKEVVWASVPCPMS